RRVVKRRRICAAVRARCSLAEPFAHLAQQLEPVEERLFLKLEGDPAADCIKPGSEEALEIQVPEVTKGRISQSTPLALVLKIRWGQDRMVSRIHVGMPGGTSQHADVVAVALHAGRQPVPEG